MHSDQNYVFISLKNKKHIDGESNHEAKNFDTAFSGVILEGFD